MKKRCSLSDADGVDTKGTAGAHARLCCHWSKGRGCATTSTDRPADDPDRAATNGSSLTSLVTRVTSVFASWHAEAPPRGRPEQSAVEIHLHRDVGFNHRQGVLEVTNARVRHLTSERQRGHDQHRRSLWRKNHYDKGGPAGRACGKAAQGRLIRRWAARPFGKRRTRNQRSRSGRRRRPPRTWPRPPTCGSPATVGGPRCWMGRSRGQRPLPQPAARGRSDQGWVGGRQLRRDCGPVPRRGQLPQTPGNNSSSA